MLKVENLNVILQKKNEKLKKFYKKIKYLKL